MMIRDALEGYACGDLIVRIVSLTIKYECD
jgi:hypothetical protein